MKKLFTFILTFAMILSSAVFLFPAGAGAEEYDASKIFVDVPHDAWFKTAVDFVGSRGTMGGAGQANTFKPADLSTRSMITVIIHRLEGEPAANKIAPFADLTADWYMAAIEWAHEAGVVKGSSETTFNPDGNITRQELVTMLYRYIKTKRVDMSLKGDVSSFADGGEVAEWAKEAVEWALGAGLISGRNINGQLLLAPAGNSQRSEMATVLMRLYEKYEDVFGVKVFYVANDGNDFNDGITEETPFKTLTKAMKKLSAGDVLCLKRGSTFYGRLTIPYDEDQSRPTTVTAYGEGENPVISQFKIAKKGAWEDCGNGVWRMDITNTANYDGNVTCNSSDVGFIKVSGEIYAKNAFSVEALKDQWDFHWEDKYVYVKSSKCPDELSDDVRFAVEQHCVYSPKNAVIENITFTGSGSHGISGTWSNVRVSECKFIELGGSRLEGHSEFTRYGNGVECWSDSENVTVEGCYFSQIYDVAMTMQGNDITFGWRNITFKDNTVENCQQAFEIWAKDNIPGAGFINCAFIGNVCRDAGYCWSYDVRPEKRNASHLLMYDLAAPVIDIDISGNVFDNARQNPIFATSAGHIPEGYAIKNNTFVMSEGQDFIIPRGDLEAHEAFCKMLTENNTIIIK